MVATSVLHSFWALLPYTNRLIIQVFPVPASPRAITFNNGHKQGFGRRKICSFFWSFDSSLWRQLTTSTAFGLLSLWSSIQFSTSLLNLWSPNLSMSPLRRTFSGIRWPSVIWKEKSDAYSTNLYSCWGRETIGFRNGLMRAWGPKKGDLRPTLLQESSDARNSATVQNNPENKALTLWFLLWAVPGDTNFY